ncbi:hypothetical protein J7S27_03390 [Carnobacteriaceae bacterium zg-C25]|nr:hypothetical protein J7S27_03390 [Carnobacteriaceae bacterium zg-C25]
MMTGVDPVTKEETNRWEAAEWLALDIFSFGVSKVGKFRKGAKVLSKTDDVIDTDKIRWIYGLFKITFKTKRNTLGMRFERN